MDTNEPHSCARLYFPFPSCLLYYYLNKENEISDYDVYFVGHDYKLVYGLVAVTSNLPGRLSLVNYIQFPRKRATPSQY